MKDETITGEISAIRFRNSDNWSVFSLKGEQISFVGTLASICEVGTEVSCTGVRDTNKYGTQLKCSQIVPALPDASTEQGVIKILQRLPGIGPAKAKAAVESHGYEEAWRLAKEDPERLGVKGLQVEKAKEVAASLFGSYSATVYLLGIGLTDHQAAMIHKLYGTDTIKTVSQYPYDLTDIDGFGFKTVFKIAIKAGISPKNDSTIYACIKYVLNDGEKNNGNIWISGWNLCDIVIKTIIDVAISNELPVTDLPTKDDVRRCIHFMATESGENGVVVQKGRVFSKKLYLAEKNILKFIGFLPIEGMDERANFGRIAE